MPCQLDILTVNGQAGPQRALKLAVSVRWPQQTPASLLSLQGRIRVNNEIVCHLMTIENPQFIDGAVSDLQQNRPLSLTLLAPISSESIRWIEEIRGAGDVGLSIELNHAWQELTHSSDQGRWLAGRVYWEVMRGGFRISRSDWLQLLKELKWQEYEIFEMPVLPLLEDPNLSEALALLRKAQDALRSQDAAGVLSHCYRALESAAKYHAPDAGVKSGFATLLQASVRHEGKRSALDSLIRGLRDHAQFARHEEYPPVRITRAEAEFVLTASVGLFSFISRRLGGLDGVD